MRPTTASDLGHARLAELHRPQRDAMARACAAGRPGPLGGPSGPGSCVMTALTDRADCAEGVAQQCGNHPETAAEHALGSARCRTDAPSPGPG